MADLSRLLPLILMLALPANAADAPMSVSEFEAFSTGKTLTYALGGEIYGAEQYLPGRKVVWAFKGEECRRGWWFEKGNEVCFIYEQDGEPQCWTFMKGASGLRAHFAGDPDGAELAAVSESNQPLTCAGPDLGV
ncbi:MAG: hypothetical protein DI533_06770 [Cereibacter sphaeroides]|uniref:DUF995 domain-containing protein n=1 Tax=Cereibacter sphaeroides TaxID=1063 RepID=A0A2W5UR68_CERSP|nr:MAG: hypothetical protein DI533_06770 [Cereibacter sphaeroides]